LKVDLGDLTTIKSAAEEFTRRERRLDVLWNNAGVMEPPKGSVTAQVRTSRSSALSSSSAAAAAAKRRQSSGAYRIDSRFAGHELQLGTNCLGHFLLTQLLHPILRQTAATSPANTGRVAWAGSLAIDFYTPPGGVDFDEQGAVKYQNQKTSYGVSKAGNLFLASEFGRRVGGEGVVSVVFNPGNLRTELQNTMSMVERYLVVRTSGAVGHRDCLIWYLPCFFRGAVG
jgi:retinol dehydrogenase-12